MSDEDYRGLSRVHLELKCGILEIERRSAKQESEEIKNFLFRRVADLAANEAITEPAARAPPVASGSGQLVPAPALPGPSERRGSAALGSMRDREPGVERSAHTRTRRAYAGSARPTTLARTSPQNAANAPSQAVAQPRESAPPDADTGNRFHTRSARELLLREAGVHSSMAMTPEDRDLFAKTPKITGRSFTDLFGGSAIHERPKSKWGILCVNRKSQPYAPHSPGKSGLVFIYPDTTLLEDTCDTFLLFLNVNPKLSRHEKQICYLGTYTKVPIAHPTVEQNEWLSVPKKSHDALLCRIHSLMGTDVREAHARISLHKQSQGGPPPTTDAIHKWLEQNQEKRQGIREADIRAAFRSGEEKFKFEVIKYVGYDRGIAELLQNNLA